MPAARPFARCHPDDRCPTPHCWTSQQCHPLVLALAVLPIWAAGLARAAEPEAAAAAAAPPAFEQVCFDDFDDAKPWPTAAELGRLLATVPGQQGRLEDATTISLKQDRPVCRLTGVVQLVAVWPADTALRLSLVETEQVQMHFWSGDHGVTLQFHRAFYESWLAYGTTRSGGRPRPDDYALWATDGGLYKRSMAGTVEVRWQQGRLVLSRGNLVLLAVPLAERPAEVYLDGKAAIRGLSIVPSGPAPLADPTENTVALDGSRPAALDWQTFFKEKASLDKLPDGAVQLTAEAGAERSWAGIPLPQPGPLEIVVELEDADQRTGIYLGKADGGHIFRLGFLRHRTAGKTTFGVVPVWEERADDPTEPDKVPPRYAARHQWFRLVAGAGIVKFFVSPDGVHWSWPADYSVQIDPAVEQFGLYCFGGDRPRSIRLRSLSVRRLDLIERLAPQAVRDRLPAVEPGDDFSDWEERVDRDRPADVPPETWFRARALRALGGGRNSKFCEPVLDRLLAGVVASDIAWQEKLRILGEAALLVEEPEWPSSDMLAAHYEALGRRLICDGHERPFSELQPSLLAMRRWHRNATTVWPAPLLRHELLGLAAAGEWQDVAKLCRRLRFWTREYARLERPPCWGEEVDYLVRWAEFEAARRGLAVSGELAVEMAQRWRDPLVERLDKENYNLINELRAAAEAGDFRAAGQMLCDGSTARPAGLVTDPADRQLLLSMPLAVESLMAAMPPLRAAMQEHFEPLGLLRVQRAMADGDEAMVRQATLQFCGTRAAAEARAWLGDRALAGGRFAEAMGHYRAALKTVSSERAAGLSARLRLAAALLGQDVGTPAQAAVQFGDVTLTAAAFEQMVAQVRQAHRLDAGADGQSPGSDGFVPPPGAYTLRPWGEIPGEGIERPRGVPDEGFDWGDRQLAAVPAEGRLLVANQLGLMAFDLGNGQRLWSIPQRAASKQSQWPAVAMRPLVLGQTVFARAIGRERVELACVRAADGQPAFDVALTDSVVSDPFVMGGDLCVLGVEANEIGRQTLVLVRLAPKTGRVVGRVRLADFEVPDPDRLACRVTVAEDRAVATLAGCALCFDALGQVDWMRRQVYVARPSDRYQRSLAWYEQRHEPPLVADRRVWLAQPGAFHVDCVELDSGRLLWRCVLPELVGVAGRLDDRLVAETTWGLVGLDAAGGQVAWRHAAPRRYGGCLVGKPGGIIYVAAEPSPEDRRGHVPALVWIDAASGQASEPLPLETGESNWHYFGPLATAGDRVFFTLAHEDTALKRKVYELVR